MAYNEICSTVCNHVQSFSSSQPGSFVRLSSSSLLTSQTVPSSTLQLLIIFVPLCAISLTLCTQSTGSHVRLQNAASCGYLLEMYENHGIPNCPDDHEIMPDLDNTVFISAAFSSEGLWMQRGNKMTKEIYICREEAMREGNRSHGYPCVSLFLFCIVCVEKEQC